MKPPDTQALERGYGASHRVYETCGIVATVGTGLWLGARVLAEPPPIWWLAPAILLALLGADLVSGLVHWGFDTWGDLDTPIVGRLAIRAFREHHSDPGVMLRHDFIETNGLNITLALALTWGGLAIVPAHDPASTERFAGLTMLAMAVFVSLTSQIHKWAHMAEPPAIVRRLQRRGLILSPQHHHLHHVSPHDRNYCITVGWMNRVLDATDALPRLERLITRLTGARPRRHG
jgi:hypothetical protein